MLQVLYPGLLWAIRQSAFIELIEALESGIAVDAKLAACRAFIHTLKDMFIEYDNATVITYVVITHYLYALKADTLPPSTLFNLGLIIARGYPPYVSLNLTTAIGDIKTIIKLYYE